MSNTFLRSGTGHEVHAAEISFFSCQAEALIVSKCLDTARHAVAFDLWIEHDKA